MTNDQIINILLVGDNSAETRQLQTLLAKITEFKFKLVWISGWQDGLEKLAIDSFELILLDLKLSPNNSLNSLEKLINAAPQSAIVLFVDANEKALAKEALSKGAMDYLVKQLLDVELFKRSLNYALRHKQTQIQLAQARRELKSSQAELEHFVYVVSHDLKQPLSNIFSWTQMLGRRYQEQLGDKGQQYIQRIVESSKQMEELLDAILDYSRIARRQNEFQPTDCHRLLSMVLARLERAIDRSNAVISYDRLPTVMGDASQITQLFACLIDNAIKYRREEFPQIHIAAIPDRSKLTSSPTSEWLFSISDNGIGIESQYFDRIFKVFQRLHSTSEYPGTGIGLAICEKIVKRHGGRIWLTSQPGLGSTFYFSLPAFGPN